MDLTTIAQKYVRLLQGANSPHGGIGLHDGLKIRCQKWREGSNPSEGIMNIQVIPHIVKCDRCGNYIPVTELGKKLFGLMTSIPNSWTERRKQLFINAFMSIIDSEIDITG